MESFDPKREIVLTAGNYSHGLLNILDALETALYRMGQETKGDPDPDTFAELERWTPEEFDTGINQAAIDEAGALLFEASDLVTKALNRLTNGAHMHETESETR